MPVSLKQAADFWLEKNLYHKRRIWQSVTPWNTVNFKSSCWKYTMFQPVKSNKEPAQVCCRGLFLLLLFCNHCAFLAQNLHRIASQTVPSTTGQINCFSQARPQPISGCNCVCIFYRNAKKKFMECVKIQLVDTTLKELFFGILEAASLRWDTQICPHGGENWSTSQMKFVAKHCGSGKIASLFKYRLTFCQRQWNTKSLFISEVHFTIQCYFKFNHCETVNLQETETHVWVA